MDLNSKYESEIEAYVHGNMSAEAKRDFEKILDSNPELKVEVKLLVSLKDSFERKDIYDLKKKLEGFSQIEKDNHVSNKSNKTFLLALAVAATVIVAFGIFYLKYFNAVSGDIYRPLIIAGLDSVNIQDPDYKYLISTTHSRNLSPDLSLSDSLFIDLHSVFEKAKLNEKELPKFIDYGNKLLNKTEFPNDYKESTRILLSRAYLLQNEPKKALEVLGAIPHDSKYNCFAQYYASMAKAILENFDDARAHLKNSDCPEFNDAFRNLELKLE